MEKIHFHNLKISEEINKALEYLEYKEPTKVQEQVIPQILNQKDLIVKSQTGSGKTASFAIPICQLVEWIENKPQALILTPTRELAVQVMEDFINIGRFKRIKAIAIYGQHDIALEKNQLRQKNHVVVGTPGRVLDHIERNTIHLEKIKYVVIDEADRMFDMGFYEQVKEILNRLPATRTTMLFSATISERIKELANVYMKEVEYIDMNQDGVATARIEHKLYKIEEVEKLKLLEEVTILENPDSCIIFCRTKERVDMVYNHLLELEYRCNRLHGGMAQKDRLNAIRQFKRGEFSYLVATDVAARGIDVENISLVINYDIPYESSVYVHRVGRTGRAGMEGVALTFVTPSEERYLKDIEEYIGFTIKEYSRPNEEEMKTLQLAFEEKKKAKPILKKSKSEDLNKNISKLMFYGGKNKKLRATNFVGVISNIEGISAEDIGIIEIQDTKSFVEILNGKGDLVYKTMLNTKIGGKQIKVKKL